MKMPIRTYITLLLTALMVLLAACTKGTYADELKAEKKIIKNFISRKGIKVLSSMPKDSVFAENEFYKTSDELYFRLDKKGTGQDTITPGARVNLRYKKYDLSENPDTISYWTTAEVPYPIEFYYLTSTENTCLAWHYAVGMMRQSGSEATIIVPAALGFSSDQSPLTPYVYKIKIKFNKQT